MLRTLFLLVLMLFMAVPGHAVEPDVFIDLKFRLDGQGREKEKLSTSGQAKPSTISLPKGFRLASQRNEPKPGTSWSDPVTGMTFVWIPSGCFMMGDKKEAGWETSRHQVCLDGFWMGKYEVTQAEWKKVMGNNPAYFKGDRNPVEQVSWNDAKKFIQKFNVMGRGGFSLPSEAQWEYAARAGMTGKWYWGDSNESICIYANVIDESSLRSNLGVCNDLYKFVAPVGQFKPNGYGLYDMIGNVWEWCEDTYDRKAYSGHSRINPLHSGKGKQRVVRGGSWSDVYDNSKCSTRYASDRDDARNYHFGFRLVRAK
ncbi:formylglycine-generating enzyme family protein [Maridesulfovibrio sp.]|uniref:formylglycine-generating enzyme family protein n=1 Tax=Maridesulfovibrio sp. TaxID=2795000 RepID=UPI003BAAC086